MKIKKLEFKHGYKKDTGTQWEETRYNVSFHLKKSTFQEMCDTASVTEWETIMHVVDNSRPNVKDAEYKEQGVLVLEQIKKLTGKTFRAFNTKRHPTRNLKLIINLLKDGRELRDILAVVDYKAKQWLFNLKMKKYLRPETLFNPTKFEAYLNEVEK